MPFLLDACIMFKCTVLCTVWIDVELRIKQVKDKEALQALRQVYEKRGWTIIKAIGDRIEAYDQHGKLKAIAEVEEK